MNSPSRPTSSRTTTSLGPVQLHRDSNNDELLTLDIHSAPNMDEVEIKKKDPLPPIGAKSEDAEEKSREKPDSAVSADVKAQNLDGDIKMSTLGVKSVPSSGSSRPPRIVNGYRRETDVSSEEDELSTDDGGRQVTVVRGYDGRRHKLVSIECQTEWSWLENMKKGRHLSSRPTSKSSRLQMDKDGASYSNPECSSPEDSGRDVISHARERSIISGSTSRHISSALTNKESYTSEPFPPRDDEYGIPVLNIDTDLETTTDDESIYGDKMEDKTENDMETIPSIGPPLILQYQRESEKTTMSATDPEARIISEEADPSSRKYLQDPDAGIFKGTCEFCHNDIKAFPTLEEQKTKPPEELYCCSSYSEFIQYMVKHPLNAEAQEDKLINVKPHLPYGSKQARKAAKERAAQRLKKKKVPTATLR